MRSVKGSGNKTTELRLRMALVRAGFAGWTMRPKNVLGRPDFYFEAEKMAVFVDGCFWHGCPLCGHFPRSNASFWRAKIVSNRARDARMTARLGAAGVGVIRFWEHELRVAIDKCLERVRAVNPR